MSFDFESVSRFFADEAERKFFEQCAAFVERQQKLSILEFGHFLKTTRPRLEKSGTKYSRYSFKSVPEYDPYTIYILIKYIGLPDMSKKLLDFAFERTIFSPSFMLQIYNDEFLQLFFSVDSRTDVGQILDSLDVSEISDNAAKKSIHEYCNRVYMYIARYSVVRLRVKFTYCVTQNIIFDKSNFTRDFYMRLSFADHISRMYNIKIFSVIIEWPSHYETIGENLKEFTQNSEVALSIRKTFHDWYSDTERKWTFSNYAKKLDITYLDDFIVPHKESKLCCDTYNIFVLPEIQTANMYLQFIKIFDSLCTTINKQINIDPNEAEFVFVIDQLRNTVPYARIKLLDLKKLFQ